MGSLTDNDEHVLSTNLHLQHLTPRSVWQTFGTNQGLYYYSALLYYYSCLKRIETLYEIFILYLPICFFQS